eukprot:15440670-Alexandrium_andersonii.AAC.1
MALIAPRGQTWGRAPAPSWTRLQPRPRQRVERSLPKVRGLPSRRWVPARRRRQSWGSGGAVAPRRGSR